MSRPKPRQAIRADDDEPAEMEALRAELQDRLDKLRATIERKRRQGWTVVRAAGPAVDETS